MKSRRWMFVGLCFTSALLCAACVPMRQRIPGERVVPSPATDSSGTSVKTTSPGPLAAVGAKPWENELEGIASWYGADFNGRLTASGEVYDMYDMTAAHKTLPLQTIVKVHNLENGKKIKVRINDRGPYIAGRVIDLSRKAARALGMRDNGTAKVRVEILEWP